MFKCESCERSYAARVASSWDFCPHCLSDSEIVVPLTFELGWSGESSRPAEVPAAHAGEPAASMTATALD